MRPGLKICRCSVCSEEFSSVTTFDRHRAGPPEKRRCLSNYEMRKSGMAQNAAGRWTGRVRTQLPNLKDRRSYTRREPPANEKCRPLGSGKW
jgi:hypothetical protein